VNLISTRESILSYFAPVKKSVFKSKALKKYQVLRIGGGGGGVESLNPGLYAYNN